MRQLLKDFRIRRLLIANTTGSIGSGITIFSVPWIMVHRAGGSDAYRWVTMATTVILFLLMPHYGAWLDRHSRKRILLAAEAFGFTATASMGVTGLLLGHFELWQLTTIYFCGMLYFTLSYPARFAFIQQIFDRSQYQSLMGLIEVQGQTAQLLAGAGGAFLADRVPLWVILFLDASTYGISYLVQSTIPYTSTHIGDSPEAERPGVWASIGEGWRWLRQRPAFGIFLTASLMPFVLVMVSNYLFPIYVSQTLHKDATWFGTGEVMFALGAIGAGYSLPHLVEKHNASNTIPATMVVFLLGMVLILAVQRPVAYLVAGVLLGFGNAGCRVARSALMLHTVPNQVMGRVGIFFAVLDRLLRTVFVGFMVIVDYYGPPAGFAVLLVLLVISMVALFRSRGSAAGEYQRSAA